mgnify:CR=1 FL=1|jgi:hypothetical protein
MMMLFKNMSFFTLNIVNKLILYAKKIVSPNSLSFTILAFCQYLYVSFFIIKHHILQDMLYF